MSDKAILQKMAEFIRYHRLKANKSQEELAHEAGISRSTLSLLEKGEPVTLPTLIQVLRVLEQLPILNAFIVQKEISPMMMVREAKVSYIKKRAGKKKGPASDTSLPDWSED